MSQVEEIDNVPRVAAVGSPSSNFEVTLDLSEYGRHKPLVGSLLALSNPMGEGSELALGTVTEITTHNQWHEKPEFRASASETGEIEGFSGKDGDSRTATIRLQAAWKRENDSADWVPSGPNLRMSPATGTKVVQVGDKLIKELTVNTEDLHYMGNLGGTDNVKLPLSIPDFSGPAGSFSTGVYGLTGSGKSQAVAYLLAGQMRHEDMGIIIVDPQSQWSNEQGMAFSPQGFAEELGRDVRVRRISTDLRLAKDAPLFTNLLKHTRLVVELGLKSEGTQDIVWYEISKVLRSQSDWTTAKSDELLMSILEYLKDDVTAERIYTTPDNRKAFIGRVTNVIEDANLFKDALHQFAPIHNLFQEKNPSGQERHDLWKTISEVFNRAPGAPAPLLILDMSSAPIPGMDEEVTEAAMVAQEILEKDTVKAAVLRNLFATLKRASEDKFRSGVNLNTLVVLDEAWRYAAPPNKTDEDELAALSKDLAGYARDTRKFGIGWLYISQSTKSINQDIWDQMSVRLFGYGLSGADIEKMAEIVDDRNALRLYRTFGNPRATGIYPFLITGPVSPLAANATPLTLQIYIDFDEFRNDNYHWIKTIRDKLGKTILTGQPIAPKGSSAGSIMKLKPKLVKNVREAIITSSKQVRENRQATGISNTKGFGDPLGELEDAPLPFGDEAEEIPF